jgi:uncharacterized Rmd1/YagE family protein
VTDSLLPIRAFAISATVQPRLVEALFAEDAERVRLTKTIALARYGATGWAVAHDFGALVFIGVDKAECERVMQALIKQLGEEPRAPALQETFAVEIAPGASPSVRFDRVVVGELDSRAVEIISLVVAQSVAMEYYEGDVDALVHTLEQRSRTLATSGTLHAGAREMLRFVGRGMLMRSQVIATLSLLDSPGATWENEALDRLYRGLRAAFEIEERYRALDHELRIVQDDLGLMIDMARSRRSTLLEAAVVVLIILELAAMVFQVLLAKK